MSTKVRKTSGYLPSLDGWRCLAILGVMFTHDARFTIRGHTTNYYQGLGGYGVQLFFAISGILISWRIIEEESRTGRFSPKAFYIRRFFRIQPVQWLYLLVVGALMVANLIIAPWRFWLGAMFMYENFQWHELIRAQIVPASYLVGHFWTLAVEEHFYLLISLFFLFVQRRRALILGSFLAVFMLGQLVAEHIAREHGVTLEYRRTYWEIQLLIFPAVAAIALRTSGRLLHWAQRFLRPWVVFLIVTPLALVVHHLIAWPHDPLTFRNVWTLDVVALLLSFTAWVVATMLHPESLTTRILELSPFRFMGRISYSLYMWHLLFFGGGNPAWCRLKILTQANLAPYRYICALLLATLSYYAVEKPLIRLGHRMAPPTTPGHADLRGV